MKWKRKWGSFPVGIFLVTVSIICVGLALSSAHTYVTLSKLRAEYLTNLGHETLRSIMLHSRHQLRSKMIDYTGEKELPDEQLQASFWNSVLEESLTYNRENLNFLAVADETGRTLANAGNLISDISEFPEGMTSVNGSDVFVMIVPVPHAGAPPHRRRPFRDAKRKKHGFEKVPGRYRRPPPPKADLFKKRRICIGLDPNAAEFIMKQARIQILTSCLAIVAIAFLAYYFLNTLSRFIKLQHRERSERHLRSLGRMGATLAHEIRNPLGAMKGLTQVVQEKLPPEHITQKSLATVVSEAERLEILVSDLLHYAKPKTIKIERIDIATLFDEVKRVIEHKTTEKDVSITFCYAEPNIPIHSDKSGLRQVLLNIIVNAIEATPRTSTVSVNARVNDKKEFVVDVIDSGEGIGNRNPDELFEPFMTTKLKGTGLGLAISRKIVEALSGTITLANNNNAGSRCTVKVPISQYV